MSSVTLTSATARAREQRIPRRARRGARQAESHRVARGARPGRARDPLSPARLALLAAALLGRAVPDDRARRRYGEAVAEESASRRAAGDRRVPAHARRTASARARAGVAPDAGSADGAVGTPRDQHDAAVGGIVLVLPALPVTHARRRRLGSRGGEVLDADRPLRRRLRACDAAPPLRAVLAQGAVRRRARLDEGAVPASRPSGHDPQALLPRRARQVSLRG